MRCVPPLGYPETERPSTTELPAEALPLGRLGEWTPFVYEFGTRSVTGVYNNGYDNVTAPARHPGIAFDAMRSDRVALRMRGPSWTRSHDISKPPAAWSVRRGPSRWPADPASARTRTCRSRPASTFKVQVAQAVLNAVAAGDLDGRAQVVLAADRRTPGPVTVSLMDDDVEMSLRDLVTLSLTISDNPATDALIEAVGVDAINSLGKALGLETTWVRSDLNTMLEELAVELGFRDFHTFASTTGDATPDELRQRIAASTALDPSRGSRTTARDSVRFLQAVWNDEAGPAEACSGVRRRMGQQLTRHRIASGFPPGVSVAAKSGGLLGIVRNEIGVVTFPDGAAYAVGVFTRIDPSSRADARPVDAAIGAVAAEAVSRLRA